MIELAKNENVGCVGHNVASTIFIVLAVIICLQCKLANVFKSKFLEWWYSDNFHFQIVLKLCHIIDGGYLGLVRSILSPQAFESLTNKRPCLF